MRRAVIASSNLAAEWYVHNLIDEKKVELLDTHQLPVSDKVYGWAKSTYEHLEDLKSADTRTYKRDLATYVCHRDLPKLFTRSIKTEIIETEHSIAR